MSPARTPPLPRTEEHQFVLDEETASHSSSQTESLLGRGEPSSSSDEKTIHRSSTHHIVIPTSETIAAARGRKRATSGHTRLVVLGLLLLLLFAYLVTSLLTSFARFGRGGTGINLRVILMISDGMGPASETMSREYLQFMHDAKGGLKGNALNGSVWSTLAEGFEGTEFGMTPLDSILVGASRTRSSSSLVTDSAAGATAFSCGIKTYNGAIGVEPANQLPCGTVLEAAHKAGFRTGVVSTSRVTHATPASFYAHVVDRDLESEIATFLVGLGPQGASVDLALGGGACFFLPNITQGSCRTDGQDLLKKAEDDGVKVLRGMKALRDWHEEEDGAHSGGRILGLFADDHMDYEIDRRQQSVLADEQPSLKEMASHALKYLDKEGGKGMFLMIEGSRIDMAAHNNDPIGHMSDMLAYHETVRFVKQWVEDANNDGRPTVMISVSDHETGGLALGRQIGPAYPEYAWYPDALLNATHSTEHLGAVIAANSVVSRSWLRSEIFEKGLGISDVTDEEIELLWPHREVAYRANRVLADAISRRAQIGWSTAGHSGVDVNLYSFGENSTGIAGNRENTEIGTHISEMMGLNLEVITLELNKNLESWHSVGAGKSPQSEQRRTKIKHYHGDF